MVDGNTKRLSKLAREYNVGIHTIVEFLHKKGFKDISNNPNTKVSAEAVQLIEKEYKTDISIKKESEKISLKSHRPKKEVISIDDLGDEEDVKEVEEKPAAKKEEAIVEEAVIPVEKIDKFKVVGKIDLNSVAKPKKKATKEKPVAKDDVPKVEKKPKPVKEEQPELKVKKEPEVEKPIVEKKKTEEPVAKQPETIAPESVETPEEEIYVHSPRTSKVDEVKVVGMIDLKNINQKNSSGKKIKRRKRKGTQRA